MRLIMILLFVGFIFSYASDLKLVEKSYLTINENIEIQQNKIDSLTKLLNKKVSFIETGETPVNKTDPVVSV